MQTLKHMTNFINGPRDLHKMGLDSSCRMQHVNFGQGLSEVGIINREMLQLSGKTE